MALSDTWLQAGPARPSRPIILRRGFDTVRKYLFQTSSSGVKTPEDFDDTTLSASVYDESGELVTTLPVTVAADTVPGQLVLTIDKDDVTAFVDAEDDDAGNVRVGQVIVTCVSDGYTVPLLQASVLVEELTERDSAGDA
jgi:hypothetical protein